ncbi:MAG: glycoside hydrolase family 18 [Anaerocolumna sp.]|nr:glycoside hydrolase family 18 [Anaerocolumna sp.]
MLKKALKLNKKVLLLSLSLFISFMTLANVSAAVTDTQRDTIYKLTSIFENSTTTLKYTYAENIGDGRGLTFGFAGFCSGTYDGTMFLKKYQSLNPNNILVKYIPAFERIDNLPHPDGLCSDTTGLANFPADFSSCGNDPYFIQAQHNLVDELYWNPSQVAASQIGAQYAITAGELYDSFINHGESGAWDIINQTNNAVGKISAGTNEKTWLNKFLSIRYAILAADPTWSEAVDRVKVYQKLLNTDNNVNLTRPLTVTCYGDTFTITGNTQIVSAPTFSPSGGTYTSAQNVTIQSATSGATIRYTIDGSTPNSNSPIYSSPINVATSRTIKAIAYKSGMTDSSVSSATYTISTTSQVATPTFSPTGGTYSSSQNVTISTTTTGATIRYTTDGSTPTATSTLYTGPISVTSTKTIKAIALASGKTNSLVASATYTIVTSGYPAWAPNTSYSVGNIVSYGGTNYQCRQSHTSLVGWEPSNVPALWLAL